MERPAPCSEQTKNPSLLGLPILFLLFAFLPTPFTFIRDSSIFLKASALRGRVALPV
jgi:hypothetical protein